MSDKEETADIQDKPKKYAEVDNIRAHTRIFIAKHATDLSMSFGDIDFAMLAMVGALSIEDSYPDKENNWVHPDTTGHIINAVIETCIEHLVSMMAGIHRACRLQTNFRDIVFKSLVEIEKKEEADEKPKLEPKDTKEQILDDYEDKPEWLKEMVANIMNDKATGDASE